MAKTRATEDIIADDTMVIALYHQHVGFCGHSHRDWHDAIRCLKRFPHRVRAASADTDLIVARISDDGGDSWRRLSQSEWSQFGQAAGLIPACLAI